MSRDVEGKAALIKCNWIVKTITATAITLGYLLGDIPQRLMILIIFTNTKKLTNTQVSNNPAAKPCSQRVCPGGRNSSLQIL